MVDVFFGDPKSACWGRMLVVTGRDGRHANEYITLVKIGFLFSAHDADFGSSRNTITIPVTFRLVGGRSLGDRQSVLGSISREILIFTHQRAHGRLVGAALTEQYSH